MKTSKTGLAIALLAGLLPYTMLSGSSCAAGIKADDTKKEIGNIQACREKIAIEREAILADEKRLKEAKKTGDKARIEQVRQETSEDIKKRKAAIRVLYRQMDNVPWEVSSKPGKVKR